MAEAHNVAGNWVPRYGKAQFSTSGPRENCQRFQAAKISINTHRTTKNTATATTVPANNPATVGNGGRVLGDLAVMLRG
jgi:hypothetical protein